MTTTEHTLTEFLQHSGRVLAQMERGGVVLRRRDGEDLVVITRGQSEALNETVRALAGVVLASEDRLTAILPELSFLSAADQIACLRELSEVASAAVATGELHHLEETLAQWKATNLAAWDEKRLRERTDYADYLVEDPQPLERPSE